MSVRDSGTLVAPAYRPFLVSVQYVLALPRPGFDRTVVGAGDGPALHRRPAGNFARGEAYWARVEAEGLAGWMVAEYLQMDGSPPAVTTPLTAPVPAPAPPAPPAPT